MAITIAVASQKGGVGKTTTAVNLAAAFRQHGHRVLLVDLDAQSSATQWLTNAYGHQGKVAGDLLMRRAMAQETVVRVPAGFDLIPSDLRLSSIDIDLMPNSTGNAGSPMGSRISHRRTNTS